MKNIARKTTSLLGLLLAAISLAAEPTDSDELPPVTIERYVAVNMSRAEVVRAMHGTPDERISADVWVYWDFDAGARVDDDRYRTMLVIFRGERVQQVRLVERDAVLKLMAQLRREKDRTVAQAGLPSERQAL